MAGARSVRTVGSAGTKVPFECEQPHEDGSDDQYFLNAAALDTRSDHQDHEREEQDGAGDDDEGPAPIHGGYAFADGGSGSPVPGCVDRWPITLRFTHANGS